VGPVDLDVAVAPDDEEPGAGQVAGEVYQVIERAAVGPVEVFDDQEDRLD